MSLSAMTRLRRAAFAAALALLAIGPAAAHEFKSGPIEVIHPWVRATPPAAKVGGGYAEIRNDGSEPDRLVSATAEVAGRVEIHQMGLKDGIMTMRPVEGGVPVPADGTAALAPGGYHLMLMELKRPLKAGESFAGTMTFEKAGTVPVTFDVQPIGSTGAAH
ncbi:copper chaperone PCu(A)C [Inquilinus sp. CA228]|uniref:copper chaperone PCu(A)C n=1 Tax=Inquilinus sp. CA228 TaxID=3455609 RepID=UPI003F8CFBF1